MQYTQNPGMQQSQYHQQPQAIASSVPEGSPAQAQQGQANYPTTVAQQQQQQQLSHHHLQQHQQQQLQMFWQGQMSEIEQVCSKFMPPPILCNFTNLAPILSSSPPPPPPS